MFVWRTPRLQERSLVLFSLRDPSSSFNKEIITHGWEPGSVAQGLELDQDDCTEGFRGPRGTG